MSNYRQNYTPERVESRAEAGASLLLAIVIGVALAALLFYGLSK